MTWTLPCTPPLVARSRKENAPSSFVPLQQPKYRSSRDRESVRDSIGMSRTEGSLSVQTPESTHAVKVLDESWSWTSRGTDVGCVGEVGVVCSIASLAVVATAMFHFICIVSSSSLLPDPFLLPEPHGATRFPCGGLSGFAGCGQVHCYVHSGRQPHWLRKVGGLLL